jgi:hypothetical protein
MKPKTLYLMFCFVGVVLPYSEFVPWVVQHGFNLRLIIHELFANRISAFFVLDVLVSAIVLFRFIRLESARLDIQGSWLAVLGTLAVGVSLGFPLFLYLRERRLDKPGSSDAGADHP